MQKSTLLHLRIPFSFFLMPIFLFALSIADSIDLAAAGVAFVALHLFVYPASNAFNSYYDRDEKSIGGLKNPPAVSLELLWFSLFFDLSALFMLFFVSKYLALGILIYGLVSKAYSHPAIRFKKYPILGLLSVAIFQGAWIVLLVYQAVMKLDFTELFADQKVIAASILATLLLSGSYPMTQIYQHEEDGKRKDLTMSRLLGIRGTFYYTMSVFGIAAAGFIWFYFTYYSWNEAVAFLVALFPVLVFFLRWFSKVWQDESEANFENTMRLNLISAICLNLFFGLLIYFQN